MRKPSLYPPREEGCFLCGSPYVEQHHIYGGTGRRPISDREGCTVYLCRAHHQGPHGAHGNAEVMRRLREDCQRRWEEREGAGHDEFRGLFGRSYL